MLKKLQAVKSLSALLLIFFSTQTTSAQMPQSQPADSIANPKKTFADKFRISGYIQAQYQYGEKDADLDVGGSNENMENSFNRFGIRRGRIRLVYEEGIASATFQLDASENGVSFRDVFLNIKDPWMKTNAIRAGIFNCPFGYEIGYSSARRESPERSTVFQTLFPGVRDLGAMVILQPFRKSPFSFLKLEAGMFAGNGINPDVDNRKDFIGHLSWRTYISMILDLGAGVSYYNGGVYQGTENVFKMGNKGFVLNNNPSNKGGFAKREYIGFNIEMALSTQLGKTKLHAEYLFGQQPGTATSTNSPNGGLPDYDTYIRNFTGGYMMFVQYIVASPFAVVVKYDWYDPNVDISGRNIGLNGTSRADIMKNTLGFGGLWDINRGLRLQAYYEIDNYEKTNYISDKSNVFTLRLQYSF